MGICGSKNNNKPFRPGEEALKRAEQEEREEQEKLKKEEEKAKKGDEGSLEGNKNKPQQVDPTRRKNSISRQGSKKMSRMGSQIQEEDNDAQYSQKYERPNSKRRNDKKGSVVSNNSNKENLIGAKQGFDKQKGQLDRSSSFKSTEKKVQALVSQSSMKRDDSKELQRKPTEEGKSSPVIPRLNLVSKTDSSSGAKQINLGDKFINDIEPPKASFTIKELTEPDVTTPLVRNSLHKIHSHTDQHLVSPSNRLQTGNETVDLKPSLYVGTHPNIGLLLDAQNAAPVIKSKPDFWNRLANGDEGKQSTDLKYREIYESIKASGTVYHNESEVKKSGEWMTFRAEGGN